MLVALDTMHGHLRRRKFLIGWLRSGWSTKVAWASLQPGEALALVSTKPARVGRRTSGA